MNEYDYLFIKNLERNLADIMGELDAISPNITFNAFTETVSGKFYIDLTYECFDTDCRMFLMMNNLSRCYVEFCFDLLLKKHDLSLLLIPLETNDTCPSIHACLKELVLYAILDTVNKILPICTEPED